MIILGEEMIKTTNVSTLRANLSDQLSRVEEGPLLVMSHSKPVAVLIAPDEFESLVSKIELMEDIIDGRKALADYRQNPDSAVDAEEVFKRLGY